MAGFRDQIESAKQMYDSGTRQQMVIQELIEHYINFITQSIRGCTENNKDYLL